MGVPPPSVGCAPTLPQPRSFGTAGGASPAFLFASFATSTPVALESCSSMATALLVTTCDATYWPKRSTMPTELKLWPRPWRQKVHEIGDYSVCYMLHVENPNIGAAARVRLMVDLGDKTRKDGVKTAQLARRLLDVCPARDALRDWSNWLNLWVSKELTLQDL